MDVVDWLADQARDVRQGQRPDQMAIVDEVARVAKALAHDPWDDIIGGDDITSDKQVRKEMAAHGWCDLLVGLLQVLTHSREALHDIGDGASVVLVDSIMLSSMKGRRPNVTDEVAKIVAKGLLAAFNVAIGGALESILPMDLIRALRILVVFICPQPERHEEVREYALRPLGDDVRGLLSDRTVNQLSELFAGWRSGPPSST